MLVGGWVAKSIEVAYDLCNLFTLYDVEMEVHADINTNPSFKSNEVLWKAMATYWEWALPAAILPIK